jgi:hypothetical protein
MHLFKNVVSITFWLKAVFVSYFYNSYHCFPESQAILSTDKNDDMNVPQFFQRISKFF